MNIDDIDMEFEGGNWLENIFARQEELLGEYQRIEMDNLPCIVPGTIPVEIDSYTGQHMIKERLYNCMIEIAEVVDCMKNKAWKQTMVKTDVRHLMEEMVDALHFYVEACILIGIKPKDLYELYFRKSEVNKFRQRSKY